MKTFWNFRTQHSETNLTKTDENPTKNLLEKSVSERGFYLYEWISEAELRESIHEDYLAIMTRAGKPLFWTTLVAGAIGFIVKSPTGLFVATFGVLSIFYIFVFLWLGFRIFVKWKIFTKFANIPITDTHLVASGQILTHAEIEKRNEIFKETEKYFHEKFLEKSLLWEKISEHKNHSKKILEETLSSTKNIFEMIANNSHKNNNLQFFVIIFTIASAIFGFMIGLTYFLGLPIVYFFAKIFSKIFKKILLAKSHTEYKIQNLFEEIDTHSEKVKNEKEKIILSLTEAKNNNWQENLSGKIFENFSVLNGYTEKAVNESLSLKKILENSEKYAKIFNFNKYDIWIKNEILAPILELLDLTEKNILLLKNTETALEKQISETTDPSHRAPLEIQKTRLQAKITEFEQMQKILEDYKEKLDK